MSLGSETLMANMHTFFTLYLVEKFEKYIFHGS
jgi:hypothetical protein